MRFWFSTFFSIKIITIISLKFKKLLNMIIKAKKEGEALSFTRRDPRSLIMVVYRNAQRAATVFGNRPLPPSTRPNRFAVRVLVRYRLANGGNHFESHTREFHFRITACVDTFHHCNCNSFYRIPRIRVRLCAYNS